MGYVLLALSHNGRVLHGFSVWKRSHARAERRVSPSTPQRASKFQTMPGFALALANGANRPVCSPYSGGHGHRVPQQFCIVGAPRLTHTKFLIS